MSNRTRWGQRAMVLMAAGILAGTVPGWVSGARADDFSQTLQKTGKAVEHSVKKGIQETGNYLKSEKFHQDVKRFTDDTAKAVRNGGDWVGQKLDSTKK